MEGITIRVVKYGNIKINSTSKIKKIKATKKNWIEKDWRLFSHGVNPHSKGLCFSFSFINFMDKKRLIKRTSPAIIAGAINIVTNIKIIKKLN